MDCLNIRYSIPEEMEEGTIIGNMASAIGLNVASLSKRKLQLALGSEKEYLNINESNGNVFIKEKIDREFICAFKTVCVISTEVVIKDPFQIFGLEVEILDVNDNAPKFPSDLTQINISESDLQAEKFFLMKAVDPDVGNNSVCTYTLNENPFFEVYTDESNFAYLVIKNALDREIQAMHNLVLTATDCGIPRLSGSVNITVTVLDINDNAPIFNQHVYEVNVNENAVVGVIVTKLKASDKDEGLNAELRYSFNAHTAQLVRETFSLHQKTGEITVRGTLDFEKVKYYEFYVQATDIGPNPISGHCKILIHVRDINDNFPEIIIRSIMTSILENIPPGTEIALFSVKDLDSEENGKVDCYISENSDFQLQQTTENYYALMTSQPMDRETNPRYNITIVVKDKGSPPLSNSTTISINLIDVNDNPPRFIYDSYKITVLENNIPGSLLCSITANDPDDKENSVLNYSFQNDGDTNMTLRLFSINQDNGNIYALQSFDYEKDISFIFQVEAIDSGYPPLSSSVTVTITILDENDNTPIIVSPWRPHGSVASEMIPSFAEEGYLVTKVIAIDEDSVQNSRITYQLLQITDQTLFTLDRYNGELRTRRRLGHRDSSKQRLVIQAKDNGSPSLSSTVTIFISRLNPDSQSLLTSNDEIMEPDNFLSLNMYLIIGLAVVSLIFLLTLIILLSVKCHRSPVQNNQKPPHNINCYNQRNSVISELPANSTLISSDAYWHSVLLAESRKGKMLVRRSIPDGSGFIISSLERNLGQGAVTDMYQTPVEKFYFTLFGEASLRAEWWLRGYESELVSGSNGAITSVVFDVFELNGQIGFLIENIFGDCVNIRYSTPEEMEEGTIIGNIASDIGLNAASLSKRKLQLAFGPWKQYLNVNESNGNLFIKEKIDREFICAFKPDCSINMEAVLKDPFQIFDIEVEILDVNDNAPKFSHPSTRINISESALQGERFLLMKAEDPDVSNNTVCSYSLNENSYFDTWKDSSHVVYLVIKNTLDREIQSSHNLLLTAVDCGFPQLSGTVKITVFVLDANDNPPVFEKEVYEVNVIENAEIGTIVTKLKASDKDEGRNAELRYSFKAHTAQEILQPFSLHPITGEISVNGALDFEQRKYYEFYVQARDIGPSPLAGLCKIIIHVKDSNDNYPEIIITSILTSVLENVPLGTEIALFSIKDLDSGDNGKVDCYVLENSDFQLQQRTDNYYALITSHSMDRETNPSYNITIMVKDKGTPPLSNIRKITIDLIDVNDNPPLFSYNTYKISFSENNIPGSLVCTLTANDPDAKENSVLKYSILKGENENRTLSELFSINQDNGNIYALQSFDYEMETSFTFRVEATDSGNPPLSSSVTVTITVLDVNDNSPIIVSPWRPHGSVATEMIPSFAEEGHLVTKIIAIDDDSVQNSRITYHLLQITDQTLFTLDKYNGELRMRRRLGHRDSSKQRLVIQAQDNGNPSLSSTVTILISKLDPASKSLQAQKDEVVEPENFLSLDMYLIVGLAGASFIFLLILIILIVCKCHNSPQGENSQKSANNINCYNQRNSVISELPANSTLISSDAYWHSVLLAESRKGKMLVRRSIPDGSGFIISSLERNLGQGGVNNMCQTPVELDCLHIRYSTPEEMEEGTVIGNIASDIGLNAANLSKRKLQLAFGPWKQYLNVNESNGNLFIKEKIDREFICAFKPECVINMEAVVKDPFQIFGIEVEILDVNDNAPKFSLASTQINISESALQGENFLLMKAVDPDVGNNTVCNYALNENSYFDTWKDSSHFLNLVIKRTLDREIQASHNLLLSATDCGIPQLSGSVKITVFVLDTNDNPPVFDKQIYEVNVIENTAIGTIVTILKASDKDEGLNAELRYSFKAHTAEEILQPFTLNPITGEISVNGPLDFEMIRNYELYVEAKDIGPTPLAGHCKIIIYVKDSNDNYPEIIITSIMTSVLENVPLGTEIALFSIKDLDSGDNGKVDCYVLENSDFQLQQTTENYYALVTSHPMDRETNPSYNITIVVKDKGTPPLSNRRKITIDLIDVNDNPPLFSYDTYRISVSENNIPGSLVCTLTANDPDAKENSVLKYSILKRENEHRTLSELFSINQENGNIYALQSFDYEKETSFTFQVEATDSGNPPLSSSVTVTVTVLDINDNTPIIVSPWRPHGSLATEMIPSFAEEGFLVTKIIAIDDDSVQNSRITYHLLQITDQTLFTLDKYNGELRMRRRLGHRDSSKQRLVIQAQDNGNPSLSSTVTILISKLDPASKSLLAQKDEVVEPDNFLSLDMYLIVGLAGASFIFLLTVIILIVCKCHRTPQGENSQKSPNNINCYNQRNSVISELPANSTLISSDAYWHSVLLAESRKGKMLVRRSIPDGSGFIISSLERNLGQGGVNDMCQTPVELPCFSLFSDMDKILFLFIIFSTICELDCLHIRYSTPEEMEEGTVIGNIASDIGLNAANLSKRKLQLAFGRWKQYLNFNESNGNLFIKEKIDREFICAFKLECVIKMEAVIKDPFQIFGIEVEILDVNDNTPKFSLASTQINISESALQGERFLLMKADDPDVGNNTVCNYVLNEYSYFDTWKDSSHFVYLVIKNSLDREIQASYNLVLTATDCGIPQLSGSVKITVFVLDANDNPPLFDKQIYEVNVSEDAAIGSIVIKLKASDKDEGLNAELRYSFNAHTAQTILQTFILHPKSGEITVNEVLDFENIKSYEFYVQAKDIGPSPLAGLCKIIIYVKDSNDNYPEIIITSILTSVLENVPLGTEIALFSIKDLDSGDNGKVDCYVLENSDFQLQQTTENYYALITSHLMDRETNPSYNITIMVKDKGTPPLSNLRKITIDLIDVNDNPPLFSYKTYRISVSENNIPGSLLFTLTANDPDAKENSVLNYSIVKGESENRALSELFSINRDNGNIYALQSFDYEKETSFTFQVEATDSGNPPLSSSVTVTVTVLDINDNTPIIVSPWRPHGSLATEMIPSFAEEGFLVTKIIAIDDDSVQNSRITYHLLQITDQTLFTLDKYNGELRMRRRLGHRDSSKQRLVIQAQDNGNPSLSSTVTILISRFESESKSLLAQNDDVVETDNFLSLDMYLIVGLAGASFIFLLTLIILIVCKCHHTPQGENSQKSANNVNCYNQRNSVISELPANSTLISSDAYWHSVLLAESRKGKMLVRRSIPDGSGFIISSLERNLGQGGVNDMCQTPVEQCEDLVGTVSTKYPPSILHPDCLFTISVLFFGFLSDMKKILILFILLSKICRMDTVDMRYSIPEEMEEGTVIGNMASDIGLNTANLSKRKLQLALGSGKQYLNINESNGNVFIKEKIDREFICAFKPDCFINMEVVMRDPFEIFGIEVEILDVNDNAPKFSFTSTQINISESALQGEKFLPMKAMDPDVANNSVCSYALNENSYFDIWKDRSNFAYLVIKNALDREMQAVHRLLLIAVDCGIPKLSGSVNITVIVLDANDNAPTFNKEIYEVNINENAPIGTVVTKLKASDNDEGLNAELRYSFNPHTAREVLETFMLHPKTGEISVRGVLDFETIKYFEFYIQAKDIGHIPLEGLCKIIIHVTDCNDNHPEIIITSIMTSVLENVPVGTEIALFSIKDLDSGDNGKVDCYVSEKSDFSLKQTTENYYALITSEPMDRETNPSYNITIMVKDKGMPPLTTSRIISINLIDVNDNPPLFLHDSYKISVSENNIPGSMLCSISANDPDAMENSVIKYSLYNDGNVNMTLLKLFSINQDNGNIYTLQSFDYEKETSFTFQVEAIDSGNPPLSSSVTVTITVLDVNDNSPIIVSPWRPHGSVASEMIPSFAEEGHLVTKIIAIDDDSVQNSRITYHLLQITDQTLFSLDRYNGELRTRRRLGHRDSPKQRLVIQAQDNGNPSLSSTVTILISRFDPESKSLLAVNDEVVEVENVLSFDMYLIIGLAAVSFIFLLTLIILVICKCHQSSQGENSQKSSNNMNCYNQRNSVISELPANSTLISSDAYWHSVLLAQSRKGKMLVRRSIPDGSGFIISSLERNPEQGTLNAMCQTPVEETNRGFP
ncbi:protocadherin Fat 1 [Polypterus senegalus]|uniref:protocadherin Fat 1 n=1 Tax=Polypterus senegalus TaxID=55291 RepID=UPI00196404A7|nr:protocadherin Fat 1 [Polypterus senegalus]